MNSASDVDALVEQWRTQGKTKEQIIVSCAEAELGWPYVWGAVGAQCTPEKRKYYAGRPNCPPQDAKNAINRCQALNGSGKYCGGCEFYPNNMRTLIDDCQGFVKQVCSRVGISFAGGGCTSMWDSASNWSEKGAISQMPDRVCMVFQRDPSNQQKMQHIGIHVGGGNIIECAKTVKRSTVSGNKAWTHYAIPKGLGGDTPMPTHPTLRKGASGPDVVECQNDLLHLGYDLSPYGADGKYGNTTIREVKKFQTASGLTADGICGQKTWAALDEAVAGGGTVLYTVTIPHLNKAQAEALIRQYPEAEKKEEGG